MTPYDCSLLPSIHTVAGLAVEMADEARGDQGLLPVERLELRKMLCGAPRAAAPERRRVSRAWDSP